MKDCCSIFGVLLGVLLSVLLVVSSTAAADDYWVVGSLTDEAFAIEKGQQLSISVGAPIKTTRAKVQDSTRYRLLVAASLMSTELRQSFLEEGIEPWKISLEDAEIRESLKPSPTHPASTETSSTEAGLTASSSSDEGLTAFSSKKRGEEGTGYYYIIAASYTCLLYTSPSPRDS